MHATKRLSLRKNEIKRLLMLGCALIAAVCLAVAIGRMFVFGVSVRLDGESLGTLESRAQAESLVSLVESQVSGVLGTDYSLGERISVRPALCLRGNVSNPASVRSSVMNGIDEVTNLYALTVDGKIIGAAASSEELWQIANDYKNMYASEDAAFTGDVSVYYSMVPSSTEQRPGRISRALRENTFVLTEKEVRVTESIPYDVEMVADGDMYLGDTQVLVPGEEGTLIYTRTVQVYNDQDMSSEISEAEIVSEPVTRIVAYGTAERPLTASYGSFIWPGTGVLSSEFGPRSRNNHSGIDIAGREGSDILAADGGIVIKADDEFSGYGNLVIIQHDDGTLTYYAHCQELFVSEGDEVYQGQLIASMGCTGRSTGTHLHFEVRLSDGTIVDPLDYLPAI